MNDIDITNYTLKDLKVNNKLSYKDRKKEALELANSFSRLKLYNRSERVHNCNTFLHFKECEADGYKKLINANFCKDRLCPICNSRRSIILQNELRSILKELKKYGNYQFIFLTLTVPNVKANKLTETYDLISKAFTRLFKFKRVKNICVGSVRSIETTVNSQNLTYHPHIHTLIAVEPSYFTDDSYINQNEWAELWQKALRVKFKPVVYVQKVKGLDLNKAVLETAKYSVKSADYIYKNDKKLTDKVVRTLAYALKNVRLVSFSGLFKKIRKELKENYKNMDLGDETDDEFCPICRSKLNNRVYAWVNKSKNINITRFNYYRLIIADSDIPKLFELSLYKKKPYKIFRKLRN